jgi:hypothetical protein
MIYIKYKFPGLLAGILTAGIFLSSCDKGFEEINTNPYAYNEPVLGSLFSYNIIKVKGTDDFSSLYPNTKLSPMQYFSALSSGWPGDKYTYRSDYNGGLFEAGYTSQVKENTQLLELTKDKPEHANLYHIARIWRVFTMHRITDMYGDVPYFDAGKGYIDALYKPKYDRQAEIYPHMLKELEDAGKALDASKFSYGSADFIYGGSIVKWKRFANSLMLRLGMRLTKVDPAMAEQYVKKAIAGGVMQSNDDIARLINSAGTSINMNWDTNSLLLIYLPTAKGVVYLKLDKTFIDHLKSTKDPRLPFYAILWEGNQDPTKIAENSVPEKQKGLPSGNDYTTIKNIIPSWNDSMLKEYSEINLNTIGHNTAPTIFQSYTEVELLLAEAVVRGWASGSAKSHYEKAVAAAMAITSIYPGGMLIPSAQTTEYLANNPYTGGTVEQQLEQIHTQFWVSGFMNNIEVYANWRRTGYPKLTPVNYPGNETGGQIPRRLRYPESEASLNAANYAAAVSAQGPDSFTTRVWWDK